MEEPLLKRRSSKILAIFLVLILTVAGGGFFALQQMGGTDRGDIGGLLKDSNRLRVMEMAPGWMGVGLSRLNFTSEAVPIIVGALNYEDPSKDPWLSALVDIIEEDVNSYCESKNVKYRFDFVPFPLVWNAEAINESVGVLSDMGAKLVVMDYWGRDWTEALKTLREKDMLYIVGVSTSTRTDTLDGLYGIRPDTPEEELIPRFASAKGLKALVVLQGDPQSVGPAGPFLEQRYTGISENFEELGGVIYKRIIYPQPEVTYSELEKNEDYTQYLSEADAAVKEATAIYGEGKVGVLVNGFGEAYAFAYQSRNMTSMMNVPWILLESAGYLSEGRFRNKELGPIADRIGLYIPVETVVHPEAYWRLSDEIAKFHFGLGPQYVSVYDGCWLMALSVIKADSTDPIKVEAALRQVAAEYDGINGNYIFDEKGDKINFMAAMYRVFEAEPGVYEHMECALYDVGTKSLILNDTRATLPWVP